MLLQPVQWACSGCQLLTRSLAWVPGFGPTLSFREAGQGGEGMHVLCPGRGGLPGMCELT